MEYFYRPGEILKTANSATNQRSIAEKHQVFSEQLFGGCFDFSWLLLDH